MKKFALLLFVALSGIFPATAQDIDHDSFELGVEAFNAGNCKEALRIMRKYEKEQPSAAYVVRICELMEPEEDNEGISYDIFMRDLKKGDLSRLDRLGMVERFSKEISGFSGAMYVQSLRENAKKNPESAFPPLYSPSGCLLSSKTVMRHARRTATRVNPSGHFLYYYTPKS